MKIYSLITISLTLGLFYALAVFEQNKKVNEEKQKTSFEEMMTYQSNRLCDSRFSTDETSFDMKVSGKDHKYLNTGITFLEYETESDPNRTEMSSLIVARDD